ncbi:hypothetical protein HU200_033131 [Digitaria exilis]|uniref:AP2/ERF domain-containing protein n=1 Tax=Digitaria exilis TaxID=1010633 RepID=A0A835BLP7_9POAL|nr:hypothetical protein HU200_033131 [Digitaria exilis]CAB3482781.1 unnamed protein product [Digitaria exilis]
MEAQRIRISFSDPDATDSDSDDGSTSAASAACASSSKPPIKQTKILILHGSNSTITSNKMSPAAACARRRAQATGSSSASRSSRNRVPPTRRSYPGVYERQPGLWAVEFRRHSIKVRHWVGTFATEAEAKAAYDAFEKQLLSSSPAPSPERRRGGGGNIAGDVHRRSRASESRREPDENRQVVLALAAPPRTKARTMVTSATACAKAAASVSVPSAPLFISSSTPLLPLRTIQFKKNARLCDVPTSLHSLWADEPIDEDDLVGLADLAHLPLPFSDDASMDFEFDPADLSLFDNGFL